MRFFIVFLSCFVIIIQVAKADNSLGLPKLKIPADNQQTAEKIELGRVLFNDKRLSVDNSISCASCHHQEKAFTDGLKVSKGINQQLGMRNAPTVVNAAFYKHFFVDGRENSLEQQALQPFINPIEHGLKNKQAIVDIVRKDVKYQDFFQQVFKVTPKKITSEHIAKAIASFERTLISGNSAFDRYYFGRDKTQLSASAARGLRLFRRKGNCGNCHEISWNNALFMDNRFYNIGVSFASLKPVLNNFLDTLKQKQSLPILTAEQKSALGRFNVTQISTDIGKFKTPTLRNIALTAPYMHDGSMQTLAEVIEYYNKGGDKNRFLDAAIFPLHLSPQEKLDIEAFLNALTSLP